MQDMTSAAASTNEINMLSATSPKDTGKRHLGKSVARDVPPTGSLAATGETDMLQTISRMIYTGSYAVAYGVV